MPQQIPVTPVLLPLEPSAQQLDGAFEKLELAQRFPVLPRGSAEDLLPTERHKSLTGLANTEPCR